MSSGDRWRRRLVGALSLVCLAASCTSSDSGETTPVGSTEATSTTQQPPVVQVPAPDVDGPTGGTLVWAHHIEPADLHVEDPANGFEIAGFLRAPLIEGLYGVSTGLAYYPELLAQEAEVAVDDDGSVEIRYQLRTGLLWSDGETLTADDVAYTFAAIVAGCPLDPDGSIADDDHEGCVFLKGDRSGYDLVTAFEVETPTRFTVHMAEFWPDYRSLFADVYAAHAFGDDVAELNENLRGWVNADGPLPSSGPMMFERWERGVSLEMVRNDRYHGTASPDARNRDAAFVDGVTVFWVGDTDASIEALRDGVAHIIMAPPELDFAPQLTHDVDFTVASQPGLTFEHWGLNLLNPHLSDPLVREALAFALDKNDVIDSLYRPILGDVLPEEGLGNVFVLPGQPGYDDHQAGYAGPQALEAHARLESAGYVLGADAIYVHPDRGRLSLRVGTTGGSELRVRLQQLLQVQMRAAGIEIVLDNALGASYLSQVVFSEESLAASGSGGAEGDSSLYDIAQFAWTAKPSAGGATNVYLSASPTNPYGFANAEFDERSDVCAGLVDDALRASCFDELDRYVTTLEFGEDGLVVLPLTQTPAYYGYRSSTLSGAGAAIDAPGTGPLANVVDFQFDE